MIGYMQTDEEKLKMYMKCNKEELAKMLIEANKVISINSNQLGHIVLEGGKQIHQLRLPDIQGDTTTMDNNVPYTLT